MKLTIHNKLVILLKKKLYYYLLLNLYGLLLCIFLYILCFGYIYYILVLFNYMIKIGNWPITCYLALLFCIKVHEIA